ncbi:fluoride efflux transporter FluC [Actinospongicola halichondriae]|uniref:fluoride efflux transporter FluC n=1 Tax=Actinospongicola halichondriae TaxID=3236844 RepID=UPI003D5C1A02
MARSAIRPSALGLVALGGTAGAAARWAVVGLVGTDGGFPWWTLLVNVVGCLLLGALLGVREEVRLGLGTGFCGGLTTFSTFTVETATMLDAGHSARAAVYLLVSLAAGVAAVVAGWRLAPSR